MPLQPGLAAKVVLKVGEEDTAVALRSGEVPVLATPRLIALCEEAALEAVAGLVPDGHTTVDRLHKEIDRPIAQLILDLESRGLLDRTLVILASEFSRDMMIEGVPGSNARDQSLAKTDNLTEMKQYGLHRHFTGASSVLMFGGGMKRGFLYGESAPERPCVATRDPITVRDLHATILTALGISPRTAFTVEKRPFYVTEDGKGQAVRQFFA